MSLPPLLCASLLLFCSLGAAAADPEVVLLWPNGAPGSEGKTAPEAVRINDQGDRIISSVHRPSLTVYLPSKETATGAAVVIAPGGAHRELWTDHEGHNVAKWLIAHGVAGVMLKYRLAREENSTYTVEGTSLDDAKRAIRMVKSRAAEWGIDPDRVGVMGFSAGGEVAALAGTRFDGGSAGSSDPIERQSSRPAFQALIYPSIPSDMNLTKDTPPGFFLCGEEDRENISQGLADLYLAFRRAGISAELHVYAGIGHGFGVRDRDRGPVTQWMTRFYEWLAFKGFLKKK